MRDAPRREDIPDGASPGDVLYELRQHTFAFDKWREETNGDLRWLKHFRAVVTDIWSAALFTTKALVVPAGLVVFAWLVSTH